MLAGLVLSYFYEPSLNTLSDKNDLNAGNQALNFYMKDMETRTFNTSGIHTNTLSSIYATQLAGQEEIHLEQPVMLIALNLAPWTAHANTGITSSDLKKISLKNDVLLSRIDGIADIKTETLVFNSSKEIAYTRSPVEILARGSRTTAKGIHIDLNKEVIHLRNHVKTYYAPETIRPHDASSM